MSGLFSIAWSTYLLRLRGRSRGYQDRRRMRLADAAQSRTQARWGTGRRAFAHKANMGVRRGAYLEKEDEDRNRADEPVLRVIREPDDVVEYRASEHERKLSACVLGYGSLAPSGAWCRLGARAYRLQRLERIRAFLREHAKEKDGEVVHRGCERARHEGHCL